MVYFVIIRGPLGVGKTTVSERLAKEIGAEYLSIDRILDDHGLWEEGLLSEFLQANAIAVERGERSLARGVPVVFDGNFYWKSQIEDLIGRLPYRHFEFTLRAPLELCIERDGYRGVPHGPEAAREVYAKSTAFDWGVEIDATRPLETIVGEIRSQLR
ncbi:MAG: AAA family ATPase [Thermoplasmata archaeon]|jgi:tRNA uridine 5-carbamoylmethylation protein Kti12